jgi:hypothetical protein
MENVAGYEFLHPQHPDGELVERPPPPGSRDYSDRKYGDYRVIEDLGYAWQRDTGSDRIWLAQCVTSGCWKRIAWAIGDLTSMGGRATHDLHQ